MAVQVTGVVGKFTQHDEHFGVLMGYLPEHEEKEADGRTERIVLVMNTYRDTSLASRIGSNDVSLQVCNLAKRNGICIIKSSDLYRLGIHGSSAQKNSVQTISLDSCFSAMVSGNTNSLSNGMRLSLPNNGCLLAVE